MPNTKPDQYFEKLINQQFSNVLEKIAEIKVDVSDVKEDVKGVKNSVEDLKKKMEMLDRKSKLNRGRIKVIGLIVGAIALTLLLHVGSTEGGELLKVILALI